MAVPVKVYTTSYCPYCIRAKALLKKRNIAFEEIDVSNDFETRNWLVQASGGMRTVPVIFIGDKSVGGSDELHALDRAGELMKRVNGEDNAAQ